MSETHPEPIDPETAPAAAPSAPRPLSLRGRAFKALALSPEPPLPEGARPFLSSMPSRS